ADAVDLATVFIPGGPDFVRVVLARLQRRANEAAKPTVLCRLLTVHEYFGVCRHPGTNARRARVLRHTRVRRRQYFTGSGRRVVAGGRGRGVACSAVAVIARVIAIRVSVPGKCIWQDPVTATPSVAVAIPSVAVRSAPSIATPRLR